MWLRWDGAWTCQLYIAKPAKNYFCESGKADSTTVKPACTYVRAKKSRLWIEMISCNMSMWSLKNQGDLWIQIVTITLYSQFRLVEDVLAEGFSREPLPCPALPSNYKELTLPLKLGQMPPVSICTNGHNCWLGIIMSVLSVNIKWPLYHKGTNFQGDNFSFNKPRGWYIFYFRWLSCPENVLRNEISIKN